ncbi:hypothetical protein F5884DRAFT_790033 [Xylogone sp. PMI_703]|nr:hypothetical protein F5884DRAFT_790033 [Xylogone sp. PMI_703]
MVFCGKASKGCLRCRQKKKKCDEQKPSCGRCVRTKSVCLGYRDPLMLNFRDESENIERKFKATSSTENIHHNTANCLDIYKQDFPNVSPTNCPLYPLEYQAVCFFFSTFLGLGPAWASKGYFNLLPQMYEKSKPDDALPEAITSIGMASLSNVRDDPGIMTVARAKYTSTLRLLGTRLSDPKVATIDETCVVVILLGLYETVTCYTAHEIRSWEAHIKAAITLLNICGPEKLEDTTGREIFLELRHQIVTLCFVNRIAVPSAIMKWSSAIQQAQDELSILNENLYRVMYQLCLCRSQSTSDPYTTLFTLFDINKDLQEWESHAMRVCKYTSITTDHCRMVLGGYYHVYDDAYSAGLWNSYRCACIFTNELIMDYLQSVRNSGYKSGMAANVETYPDAVQWQAAEDMILSMCLEICASTPYYFNFQGCDPTRTGPQSAASCQLAVWPLYVAGSMGCSSDMMRGWVMAQLIRLGSIIGTRHTTTLAMLLKSKEELADWLNKT